MVVVTLDDVRRMAMELPEVNEGESYSRPTWFVGKKSFVWERPFSKADVKRFGDATPPEGPFVAVRTEDLAEKEALREANPKAFFTIPHFDGYPAVLIQLREVTAKAMREALLDAWLAVAPPKLAESFLQTRTRTEE